MVMTRLQKILSAAGLGSRRACEEYIKAGRVKVDGVQITKLGAQADPDIQTVSFDGKPLTLPRKLYFILNKPVGYLCTNKPDRSERPLAVDLIHRPGVRLFCAGRLDVDSKGAIIVTNDGSFSNYITHPRYNVPKTYRVRVNGTVGPDVLAELQRGVWLSEGKMGAIEARIIRVTRKDTLLRLVLKEGKNRVIRRVMAKLGLRVTELERTRIGPVALGKLKPGAYRELKAVEVRKLMPGKR
ncbi:MAG: pseudouridine synthase [Planctomycetota bacterium]|jgi:23S rRNA pseudouridine2605 synthase